jgi:hypothetical protein
MVTILPPHQKNVYDETLLQEGDALWVEGIGAIAQHHCWLDMLWSSGIVYAFRDIKRKELSVCSVSDKARLQQDVRDYELHISSHTSLKQRKAHA